MRMLDISTYLAPGCSYAQFLKAYNCDVPKGIFPYEWFDFEEKLSYRSLQSAEDFYSTLKKENPIKFEEDYQQLVNIWNNEGMQTFKDYLIYYNNLDTGPFCIALEFF